MQYDEIGVQNKAFKIDKGVDSYNNRWLPIFCLYSSVALLWLPRFIFVYEGFRYIYVKTIESVEPSGASAHGFGNTICHKTCHRSWKKKNDRYVTSTPRGC